MTQVLPFPVEVEYPTEVEGVAMPTYLDWMESCWCITVTGLPAISVPCGRTPRASRSGSSSWVPPEVISRCSAPRARSRRRRRLPHSESGRDVSS